MKIYKDFAFTWKWPRDIWLGGSFAVKELIGSFDQLRIRPKISGRWSQVRPKTISNPFAETENGIWNSNLDDQKLLRLWLKINSYKDLLKSFIVSGVSWANYSSY